MVTKTTTNNDNGQPVLPPVEEIAQAIVDLSVAARRMMSTRLTEDAIVILLQAMSGSLNRSDIRTVLVNLQRMDKRWLKPLPKKESK